MDADYPAHLLAREPAPPYEGEGSFAVWHVSEDPSLGRFVPRSRATSPEAPPLVWAVDTPYAYVLVPEGVPAGMYLAGVGHDARGS